MKKRTLSLFLAAAAVYLLLLFLLTISERSDPSSNIRTLFDAFWYSLVTLTTVGYGDLYPVSPVGRMISLVFVLLSMGVLAGVIGAAAVLIRRDLLPALRLRSVQRGNCYVFSAYNPASDALARDVLVFESDARVIFCDTDQAALPPDRFPRRRMLCTSADAVQFARRIVGSAASCRVFLISDDELQNLSQAKAMQELPCAVYCRGTESPLSGDIRFFDAYSCCARLYWQTHPLGAKESVVLLAGDGRLAQALLDQAVLVNCRIPFMKTVCHAFGDWTAYRSLHPALPQVFGEPDDPRHDSLIFHSEAWCASHELTESADRIIFCGDDFALNIRNAALLSKYCPAGAAVHVAAPHADLDCTAAVFTRELVMRSGLDRQGRLLHAAYCRSTGSDAPWESLTAFLKESNRASGDHLLTKLRLLLRNDPPAEVTPESCRAAFAVWQSAPDKEPFRRNEHERWEHFHALYNWRYGPEKDSVRRTHPCMVPYEQLSEADKAKDDFAWEQIGILYNEESK